MSDPSESPVPGADQRSADLRIISRNIGDEEAAAVTAVILASVDEDAAVAASADDPVRDPWVRSSGAMRRPIEVGPGRWVRSGL
ncbi:acyl-CoA carboxylase subunit epsilon [Agromyces sp. SYSU K20354]|uniref:acyl-CoA carboxylase subunit epsilon n=1 Tax=Agromyces cavernae TaxID=2898659 RepID=UPI001E35EB01|nr:acyl-CoA carboxylase subunit epsilon [Agromyces cavernae]MCD2444090.1 acyl-CoA carboxylase subunit epsilon [Agromyces cavernae]